MCSLHSVSLTFLRPARLWAKQPHLNRGRSQRKDKKQPHKGRQLNLRKDMVQWQIATRSLKLSWGYMVGVGRRISGGYEQYVAQVYTSLNAGLARLRRPSEKEDVQSWKPTSTKGWNSTSAKPSAVTWNFVNVLSSRREGVVKKELSLLGEISMPSSSSASEGGSSNYWEESEE